MALQTRRTVPVHRRLYLVKRRLAAALTSLCVLVKNRVRVRVSSRVRVRVRVYGLGLGFRDPVPIRNIIGGAAGAHISMTSYA